MPPKLTVHNAEVRTATVEIKTLTVSGRQVTLAVFRQLPESPLIAEDGAFNGVLWGRVNYHPDQKTCPEGEHLHVVWQKGAELRRATVMTKPTFEKFFHAESGEAYLNARVRDALAVDGDPKVDRRQDLSRLFSVASLPLSVPVSDEIKSALFAREMLDGARQRLAEDGPEVRMAYYRPGAGRPVRLDVSASAVVRAHRHELEVALAALGEVSLEEAHADLVAETDQELQRRHRQLDARRALADLPQLFIAV